MTASAPGLATCPSCGTNEARFIGGRMVCMNPSCEAAAIGRRAAIDLREFLSLTLPARQWLIPGLLQECDLAMVHSYRGVGKTLFVHGLAYAVACGSAFLRYGAPARPRGVLVVDGEMPREALQGRLLALVGGTSAEPSAPFELLAADMLEDPLPSLAGERGQEVVEANLEGVSLLVLDNISTLCATGKENEAESWEAMQRWLLSLRRRGYTVLLVHHDGKGGSQRGTSKREDVLSQVIQLRRPADYNPSLGARFEVHLTKARGVYGDEAEPFEAELRTGEDGFAVWTWRPLEDAKKRQVLAAYQDGVTKQREIAKELDMGLGTVNRKLKQLREEGII